MINALIFFRLLKESCIGCLFCLLVCDSNKEPLEDNPKKKRD
jgi:formate hydrogenlyase subunit 6/NADH:ubiquinone oxidoreductase subunit I